MMALVACAPPVNLNKSTQTSNAFGTYTASYSDKWSVEPQFGRIAFASDDGTLEAYLRNAPIGGEAVAGGIFATPKGASLNTPEEMLISIQETMVVSLINRQTFTENSRAGISGTGTTVLNNIAVDVGVAVVDLGEAFGFVIYYTASGKVNNPMYTMRRVAASVNFTPTR